MSTQMRLLKEFYVNRPNDTGREETDSEGRFSFPIFRPYVLKCLSRPAHCLIRSLCLQKEIYS